jgi:hypothetical protein
MSNRPFSADALAALVEAVTHLARSEGTLANRLTQAERYLVRIRPADMDSEQWGRLVQLRGTIHRGRGTVALQRASKNLVDLLVCYTSQRPQS